MDLRVTDKIPHAGVGFAAELIRQEANLRLEFLLFMVIWQSEGH